MVGGGPIIRLNLYYFGGHTLNPGEHVPFMKVARLRSAISSCKNGFGLGLGGLGFRV